MDRQQRLQPTEPAVPGGAFRAGHWTEAASVAAAFAAVGLQFVDHVGPLFGRSATAVSGATILAASIVFTALIMLASYHQMWRSRQYEDALDEAAETSDLIAHGQLAASRIQAYRGRPEQKAI